MKEGVLGRLRRFISDHHENSVLHGVPLKLKFPSHSLGILHIEPENTAG
jgi:hypothetical protein